jgi:hypothetical protein
MRASLESFVMRMPGLRARRSVHYENLDCPGRIEEHTSTRERRFRPFEHPR